MPGTFVSLPSLKRRYNSADDNVVKNFYNPVLSQSTQYDRAVGYFSSSALLMYIRGLQALLKNGGTMRLLMSPFVSEQDARAYMETQDPNAVFQASKQLFDTYLMTDQSKLSAELLVALIREEKLVVKFVVPTNVNGLFHDKIGIFRDLMGDMIAINGSNNETGSALTINYESFNVFNDLVEGQEIYAEDIDSEFSKLWEGKQGGKFRTLSLSDAVHEDVLIPYDTHRSSADLFDLLQASINRSTSKVEAEETTELGFKPYDFQSKAADKWSIEYRGIISFATGTGKTKTALLCIDKYFTEHEKGVVVVCVPDKTLNKQWYEQVEKIEGWNAIQCFSDNPKWRVELNDALDEYEILDSTRKVIIVTNDTYRGEMFSKRIRRLNNDFMFISDECHHFGTKSLLSRAPAVEYRLGLSATPYVYGNDALTSELQEYFGGIIAEYPLDQAIRDGYLTEYDYHPIVVGLSDDELDKYRKISKNIALLTAKQANGKLSYDEQMMLEQMLFKRARIVYSASEKMPRLSELISTIQPKDHLLVYCGVTSANEMNNKDGLNQLEDVNHLLSQKGIIFAQYTKNENGKERAERIDNFKDGMVEVLTAIRCLDEGVDIPEIRSAIIMASSTNPREFIQRRGRLLRKSPGKDHVDIYDMVVMVDDEPALNKNELTRVREFANAARNSEDIEERFTSVFAEYLEEEKQ